MKLFMLAALLLFSCNGFSASIFDDPIFEATETTEATSSMPVPTSRPIWTSRGYRPGQDGTNTPGVAATSSSLPQEIVKPYETLKRFYSSKKRKERYAYINIPKNKGKISAYYQTYVVDLKTGKVADKFVSLIGYRGIGCGKGQTRPGIFSIGKAHGTGGSRKPWWGNQWQYQVINNIGGHSSTWGGRGCGQSYNHVAHSNRYVTDTNPNRKRNGKTSKSAGCFVTSPDNFLKWTKKQAGNALIYNVN